MIALTDAGIVPQTATEILAELVAAVQLELETPDLTDAERSNLERLLSPIASREAQLQAAIAALVWSPDPASASGASLVCHATLAGTRTLPAVASTILLRVGGVVTTDASGRGVVDPDGALWILPASTIIPALGYIDVEATAAETGPLGTPSPGVWTTSGPAAGITSVTALGAAVPGALAETAAELRARLAARRAGGNATLGGIYARIAQVPGIGRHTIHERRASTPDPVTLNPAHSLELVAEGGADAVLAETLLRAASATAGLVGLTEISTTLEEDGRTRYVGLTRAAPARTYAQITIYRAGAPAPLPANWSATVRAALVAWASGLALAAPATAAPAEAAVAAVLPPLSYTAITVRFSHLAAGPFQIYRTPGPRAYVTLSDAPGPPELIAPTVQPYTIGVGWTLEISVDAGAPVAYTFGSSLAAASASTVASTIVLAGVTIDAYLGALRLTGLTTGASASIEITAGSTPALLAAFGWSAGDLVTGTVSDLSVGVIL